MARKCLALAALVCWLGWGAQTVHGQGSGFQSSGFQGSGFQGSGFPGSMVRQADVDFEASGYVTPAGMVPPEMYRGPVMPVGYCESPYASAPYAETGYGHGGGCDGYGHGCGGGCGPGCQSCGYGCLGKLFASCDGMCPLRRCCLFCGGQGCECCQLIGQGHLLGLLRSLLPYQEAGLCAQRWYDLSAEAVFLSHNGGLGDFAVTSLGIDGPRVLSTGDAATGGDLELGMRLSGALIFGAGGNLEGTYMGNQSWDGSASFTDPVPDNFGLYSFLSDFGQNPLNGFDDTDRSQTQTVSTSNEFHSAELNYRRRTVGPYCRFQWSWLAGLRYLRFDDGLLYTALGDTNNTSTANLLRFFTSDDQLKNEMWGPQLGFDLWWNVVPGVNVGLGMKGAWVQNDIQRRLVLTANSLTPPGASPGTLVVNNSTQDTTVIGDLEAKLVYRLTHSWSIRSAYYLVAIDDAAFGNIDADVVRNFVDATGNPSANLELVTDDLVLQGFSIGAEYIW